WWANSTPRAKLVAGLLVFSLAATAVLFFMSGAADPSLDPKTPPVLYMAGVLIKLIAVLLLIFISAIIFRRWMNLGPQGGISRQMHVIETLRLSPKQALHLVSIGDQQLLIGSTDTGISLLSQFEAGELALPAGHTEQQNKVTFADIIHSQVSANSHEKPEGQG
ncbi:MAG: flagellar biosynthetic protein FliO, partial [Chloroflexota bacterium]